MSASCSVEPSESLYTAAQEEALRHKWIESEKQGHDVGERAIRQWYERYWPGYCREKRLEHLEGLRRWREFRQAEFGQLYSLIIAGDLLTDRILDRYFAGRENLEIINWAMDWGLPMQRVMNLLCELDVNQTRLDPR